MVKGQHVAKGWRVAKERRVMRGTHGEGVACGEGHAW